ncbi:uncharacterized protein LOC131269532 [Anopheles coustani]|uniref:uncharacterized protein LOC131269532 n=1 Tax=Anopheles coustani TaxID=139045 RepID=UPI00265B57CA|nr:uncharacterized protein LOC131269532 [Anopheles coustani]
MGTLLSSSSSRKPAPAVVSLKIPKIRHPPSGTVSRPPQPSLGMSCHPAPYTRSLVGLGEVGSGSTRLGGPGLPNEPPSRRQQRLTGSLINQGALQKMLAMCGVLLDSGRDVAESPTVSQ